MDKNMLEKDKRRLQVFLAPDTFKELEELSEKIGMSMNKIAQLSITVGLATTKLALSKKFGKSVKNLEKGLDNFDFKKSKLQK